MKSYLQYTGKWRIIIDIIKNGKKPGSRTMVPVSLQSMVKRFFEDDDLLDERAINYYKTLEGLNVHLYLNEDDGVVDTIEPISISEESIESTQEQQVESEQTEESVETTESEQIIEESVEEEAPTEETIEESAEVVESSQEEPVQPIEESDRAEVIAYLDATYDKDGLKNLAKELGVEFNNRISEEKLIEKLIDEKYSQILEMMK